MVYVGSKARLAKYLVPIIQEYIKKYKIENYIEPFVGGANIIDKIKCKNKCGYDLHNGLIDIYNAIQLNWNPPLEITEEDYINAKNNKILEPLKSYIGFNGSYASKYFGGFARGYKSDGITSRDIYNERTRNFFKQIPNLQYIKFEVKDFINIDVTNTLIYCDPPYENTTKYSTKKFNHKIFWNWVRIMEKRNNIILISEFNAPYDFISIWSKERVSSLDKNTGNKKNIENLFILKKEGL